MDLDRPIPRCRIGKDDLAAEAITQLTIQWSAGARLGEILAEVEASGCQELFGYRTVVEWVQHLGRMTRREAKAIVERALATCPGRHLDGTPTEPLAPLTGTAATAGEIGPHHVSRIVGVLKKIPAQAREGVEKILVDLARVAGPTEIDKAGTEALAHLDPDGDEPKDTTPPQRRAVLRIRERKDGWYDLDSQLDPVTGARLSAALSPLATPRPSGEETWPDSRTPDERHGEAFAEFVTAAMAAPDLNVSDRAQLLVTMRLSDLQTGQPRAHLDFSAPLSASEALRIACDCRLTPALLSDTGEPLNLGHAQRLITKTQRKALALRDRGCAFPGCTRKPRYCEGHHLIPWHQGGKTDLGNLTLLCAHHHRLVHNAGWDIQIAADGLPEFIPPTHIDPNRRPRRNTLHPPLAA